MAQKPSIPKGTRDFSPAEVARRQYIINTIQRAFSAFGFLPIETPAFENLDTLTGKYGDEGDQLIFRILRSGNFVNKANQQKWEEKDAGALAGQIADKALRYDLTVPFARYVVQHQNELAFPFKRYQIQPVWRADRPQKGRFREFYQCDADVVGSQSLWQEVEFVQLYDEVFTQLNLPVTIRINNRKILAGLAEVLNIQDKFVAFTVALDKLDKIGAEGVVAELERENFPTAAVEKIKSLVINSGAEDFLAQLERVVGENQTAQTGIDELKFIREKVRAVGLKSAQLIFDFTLARGLNYYTGSIFEVVANNVQMGSIGGGGRYDDLTGIFGLKNMSGVGISFGLDRIYLCLEAAELFGQESQQAVQALFLNFGDAEATEATKQIAKLRNSGVSAELYPEAAKLKKQFDYATKKGIRFAVFLGEAELQKKSVGVKNLETGTQKEVALSDLVCYFMEA